MLLTQGVDVRALAGLLGHVQPGTNLDIYSHALDKNKRLAGQKAWRSDGTVRNTKFEPSQND